MKILCLANSYKEKGRCLAGLLLDDNNSPVLQNDRPVWIRPVCKTEHGQIPNHLCSNISLLDIVQINNPKIVGKGYQSENTIFDDNSIRKVGTIDSDVLNDLTDNGRFNLVFGNKGRALNEGAIQKLNHSLMLVRTNEFEVIERERKYDDREYPQIRLTFKYANHSYDLPITDPDFLDKYAKYSTLLNDKIEIYLTLSLAVVHNEWYSKLIAGIIY